MAGVQANRLVTATTTTSELVKKRAERSARLRRDDIEIVGPIGSSEAVGTAYLTASGAARVLNCSISTVQRMARKGTLRSTMDDAGIRRYTVFDVEALKQSHTETERTTRTIKATMPWDPDRLTGTTSAEIFRRFKDGISAIDVIIELKVSPSAVRRLHNEWMQMRDMVSLDASQYRQVRSILATFDALELDDNSVPLADNLVKSICNLPGIVCRRDALLCEVCVATEAKAPARATRCKTHGRLAR